MPTDTVHSVYKAEIASGDSESAPVDLGGRRLFGIVFPDTMTSSEVGFKVKADGAADYVPMYDEAGDEITMTVQVGKLVVIDAVKFLGVSRFKVHCGLDGADTPEDADRELILLTVA